MTEPSRLSKQDELFHEWYSKYLEVCQYVPTNVDAMSMERGGEAVFPQLDLPALLQAKRKEQLTWERFKGMVEEPKT